METKPIHLVIRFSETMFAVGDVVALHNDVVDKLGTVWFGKIGVSIALPRIESFNTQIDQKIPTFLYLIKGNRGKITPYKAELLCISRNFPKKEETMIPPYYAENKLLKSVTSWIKIGYISKIGWPELSNLKPITSAFGLEEILLRSSSGYYLVHARKSVF